MNPSGAEKVIAPRLQKIHLLQWGHRFFWLELQEGAQTKGNKMRPLRELTYPTLGKGKSSTQKCHFWEIC